MSKVINLCQELLKHVDDKYYRNIISTLMRESAKTIEGDLPTKQIKDESLFCVPQSNSDKLYNYTDFKRSTNSFECMLTDIYAGLFRKVIYTHKIEKHSEHYEEYKTAVYNTEIDVFLLQSKIRLIKDFHKNKNKIIHTQTNQMILTKMYESFVNQNQILINKTKTVSKLKSNQT